MAVSKDAETADDDLGKALTEYFRFEARYHLETVPVVRTLREHRELLRAKRALGEQPHPERSAESPCAAVGRP